ncbi:MAG: metabolite traffic protein EboE [Hyphomonadaceae bacterium]|jgi:sugar phosphate isomerase/epimerase|nr:metabolite traffic protein EboE [Hyphomonadaceae bacterium]
MQLDHLPGDVHLTYCTNIHAGETWGEILASLRAHVPQIKAHVSPHRPMGLGLRLSAIAAEALQDAAALQELQGFLAVHDLYVFTVNAFPFGPFHGARVKEAVYQPDWLRPERLIFTDRVAHILADLLPAACVGSISTVPGTFKSLANGPGAARTMALNIARHAATLVEIKARTGREIVLALEPEPCCFLETVEETTAFFHDHLLAEGAAAIVAERTGLDLTAARGALKRHVGVCYDICHGAVEFEDPRAAFKELQQMGIRIAKLQLSSALRVPKVGSAAEQTLSAFDDGVYLHQVVQQRDGTITRWTDLGPAFEALRGGEAGGEWRVHCHVPIFLDRAGAFHSTQPTLKAALACARGGFVAPHLEVETYTWDVLPPQLRDCGRAEAIARELAWVIEELRSWR